MFVIKDRTSNGIYVFLRIYYWNNTFKNTFLTLTIKSHVGNYPTNVIYLTFCMTLNNAANLSEISKF